MRLLLLLLLLVYLESTLKILITFLWIDRSHDFCWQNMTKYFSESTIVTNCGKWREVIFWLWLTWNWIGLWFCVDFHKLVGLLDSNDINAVWLYLVYQFFTNNHIYLWIKLNSTSTTFSERLRFVFIRCGSFNLVKFLSFF